MVSSSKHSVSKRVVTALAVSLGLALPPWPRAPTLPPGPPIAIQMVDTALASIPQYTRVDIPMLREALPTRSGGRIRVTLASGPERNLTGPDLIRVLRSGQIDLAGLACRLWPAIVPLLDIIDMSGLNPSRGRGAASPMRCCRRSTRNWSDGSAFKIVAFYPFPVRCCSAAIPSPASPT